MRVKKGMVSYIEPVRIDTESSPTTVYMARNIKKVEEPKLEVETGKFKDVTMYTYDLYIYTRAEFELVEEYLYIEHEHDEMIDKINHLEKDNFRLNETMNLLIQRISVLESKMGGE